MSQKSIIVTGAAGRIGAATALLAASKGWAVAVHNRSNPESSEKVVSNIKNSAGLLMLIKAYMAYEEQVMGLFRALDAALRLAHWSNSYKKLRQNLYGCM